ncbi:carboxylesterase family protein [Agromyces endophyticus]|uniref:carboxylesterase/lipase family protein n=1 Tax=Agromyces sp. H17E-10 TaxID=2932244 RepID=UPI001FD477CB|nr:carboxylesterase family protein [Agromyces sp. H17E-10]UOQ89781.1 carboxylesterase family protein [Agromyces sp. H17E-10]
MTVPVVAVSSGRLRGTRIGGVARFLGVPYAAAPFGDRRFSAPQPHPGWPGERDASSPGATSPQAPYGGGLEHVLPSIEIAGDEILNLNVWAPDSAMSDAETGGAGAGLPVMVWVHGGALSRGANALDSYDGTPFARDGVVFVSVNYRVGSEGFSVLDDAPLNLGLLDVIAALRWTRREIAQFGGDPARVTVAGQSAGASLIAAVLAHPEASGLVDRAILQSGPLAARPREQAARITRLIAKDLGVAPTREAFSSIAPDALVAAQLRVTAGTTPVTGGPGFALAIGEGLPDPEQALVDGAADAVPVLIGCTAEEARLWLEPTGLVDRIGRRHLLGARIAFRIRSRTMRRYRENRPDLRRGDLFGVLATDLLLRLPINRWADARLGRGAATWVYEFAWRSPRLGLGAAHCMDLPAVFDRLDAPDAVALTGGAAPASLAAEMHGAWVAFCRGGDPGWEPWNRLRPVRTFDTETRTVFAPREDERASWG